MSTWRPEPRPPLSSTGRTARRSSSASGWRAGRASAPSPSCRASSRPSPGHPSPGPAGRPWRSADRSTSTPGHADRRRLANGGGGGGITVTVMLPRATVSGTTRAYASGGSTLTAGAAQRPGPGPRQPATATTVAVAVAGAAGAGADPTAVVNGLTEAFAGNAVGSTAPANVMTVAGDRAHQRHGGRRGHRHRQRRCRRSDRRRGDAPERHRQRHDPRLRRAQHAPDGRSRDDRRRGHPEPTQSPPAWRWASPPSPAPAPAPRPPSTRRPPRSSADGATIDTGGAAVSITASSPDPDATAESRGGCGGAVSVTAMIVRANLGGATRAYVGNGATVRAGSLALSATSTNNATAEGVLRRHRRGHRERRRHPTTVTQATEAYVDDDAEVDTGHGRRHLTPPSTITSTADSTRRGRRRRHDQRAQGVGQHQRRPSPPGWATAPRSRAGSLALSATATEHDDRDRAGVGVGALGGNVALVSSTDRTTADAHIGPARSARRRSVRPDHRRRSPATGRSPWPPSPPPKPGPPRWSSTSGCSPAAPAPTPRPRPLPISRAFLGQLATVDALGGAVSFDAAVVTNAVAYGTGVGASAGLAAAGAVVDRDRHADRRGR